MKRPRFDKAGISRAISWRAVLPVILAAVAIAAPLMLRSGPALATYPDRTIRVIVPFAAGGTVDVVGRLLANGLAEDLKCTVIIDNRGGAGGSNGIDAVAKSTPDGYTLLASHSGLTAMPGLFHKLSFDPVNDLQAIITATANTSVLAVNPKLPFKSVTEIVASAKAKPRGLTYASAGIGSTAHLASELFNKLAGIEILHVPYKGSAPAIGDLLGGHVDMMFGPIVNILPLVKSGQLRGIAITSQKRTIYAPELPTMIEGGFGDFVVDSWFGLAAPAATPRDVVLMLNDAVNRALRTPVMIDQLRQQSMEPVGDSPEAAAALIRAGVEKWTRIIREAGIGAQ